MLTSSIEHDWRDGIWLVRLTGEFPADGHVRLRRIIGKCLAEDPAGIVVDLAHLAPGVQALPIALATEQRRTARSGVSLVYVVEETAAAELKATTAGRHLVLCPSITAGRFLAALVTPHRWLHVALDQTPSSVADACARTAAACLEWDLPHLRESAQAIAAELVANAIRHTAGEVRLTVSLQGDLLRIRVYDHSPRLPIQPVTTAAPVDVEPTSGLEIVAQHATAWGARVFDGGKIVWATVRAQSTVAASWRRPSVAAGPDADPAMIHVGGLTLDPTGRRVWLDGRPLGLTTREFDLLSYLMHRAGTIVTRRELLTEIWRQPPESAGRTLDVYLCWLRRKLGEDGRAPRYLHRIRGLGIRLSAPPE